MRQIPYSPLPQRKKKNLEENNRVGKEGLEYGLRMHTRTHSAPNYCKLSL